MRLQEVTSTLWRREYRCFEAHGPRNRRWQGLRASRARTGLLKTQEAGFSNDAEDNTDESYDFAKEMETHGKVVEDEADRRPLTANAAQPTALRRRWLPWAERQSDQSVARAKQALMPKKPTWKERFSEIFDP